jgi:hypothetical protein
VEFRNNFKWLKSLAFAPTNCVLFAFKKLEDMAEDEFKPLIDYFEEHYIGKPIVGSDTMRKAPHIPIEFWNVNKRVIEDLPRTNNPLESWHKQFEMDCKKPPSFNKIIEQFRLDQSNTDVLYAQIEAGNVYHRKKEFFEKDERIKDVLFNCNKRNVISVIKQLIVLI